MVDHPILFSGPMVRAILAGEKTVTRRPVRIDDRPIAEAVAKACGHQRGIPTGATNVRWLGTYLKCDAPDGSFTVSSRVACPLGDPDDRLWVRETWCAADTMYYEHDSDPPRVIGYRADLSAISYEDAFDGRKPRAIPASDLATWGWDKLRWRPSIHMPRWASRLSLVVVRVGAQRVQDITEEDAQREGVGSVFDHLPGIARDQPLIGTRQTFGEAPHRASFAVLWDDLYAYDAGASWKSNPWVWRVEFTRQEVPRVG